MAEDRSLIKELKELRKKEDKRKAEAKYSIVCDHILFSPFAQKAIYIGRTKIHPKDSGRTWLCDPCALIFENKVLAGYTDGFRAVEETAFRDKVLNYVQ